jgi:hypothetical protein
VERKKRKEVESLGGKHEKTARTRKNAHESVRKKIK